MPQGLTQITSALRKRVDKVHQAREHALGKNRAIIQASSRVIKHIHRHEFDAVDEQLEALREMVRDYVSVLEGAPSIRYAPYVQDAIKEYVEAATLRAIISGKPLPNPEDLNVEPPAFLNGLCEAASELRRYALDEMRSGDQARAKSLVNEMEDIYDELITFDYPDALLSNLRRSVDALRAVLERTHSDLAVTGTQIELIEALKQAGD